ncbi:MAG: HAD hydrolase family protein [Spirochaetes bacterium]|nr:HAD hydrolase family protein [Spirochaetota bacterium]
MKQEIKKKLKMVKLIILDVDGVLTDGGLYYTSNGEEMKKFCVKDGSGIKMALQAGYKFVIVTGRVSTIVIKRASELGIEKILQGIKQKGSVIAEIKKEFSVKEEEMAFVADDVIDMELFKKVGLKVAVADAHQKIKKIAHINLRTGGGRGAVREFIDMLLEENKLWKKALEYYT